MIRKIGLPLLAAAGIVFSIFMVFWSQRTPPIQPILFQPPKPPYLHYVAGEGIIESFNENVIIGTSFPDLVWEVYVKAGDRVKKGTPLFKLDTRQQEADLQTAYEELNRAQTRLKDKTIQFNYYKKLCDKNAVSKQEYTQAFYDMKIAQDQIEIAQANVNQLKTIIERAYIIAPKDGTILQTNARVGEFANVNPFDRIPLMIFGDTSTLQLRVTVAEEDAWRIQKAAPATAFVRGNSSITIPLKFNYIEPYIRPKQVLTGSDIERVDTRVLEIIYTFEPKDLPIYVGQLLDVYVEAQPSQIS